MKLISIRKFSLIISIGLISFGLSFAQKKENDFEKDIEPIINTVSPKYQNHTEEEIVYKQLYGFLHYAKKFQGKKWNRFINDFQTTKSLTISFINI